MADVNESDHHDHPGPFQLLLVLLSVYVLVALALQSTNRISDETKHILDIADSAICVLFLIDFFARLVRSKNRLHLLKWGWIDFVSSIPALHLFRWGRLVRIARVFRILRAVRSTKTILAVAFESRAKGTLAAVVLAAVLLVTFASIAILHVETDADSNIRNAGDALWWSLATITTVGYGDRYPTTAEGRLLGFVLMTAGVGIFGVFTGYVAHWFTDNSGDDQIASLRTEVAALTEEVRQLRISRGTSAGT